MAASANQKRKIALEIVDNVATLKTAVDGISTVVEAWTLDGNDSALPSGSVVKAQLVAYNAVTKGVNSIVDDLAAIMAET